MVSSAARRVRGIPAEDEFGIRFEASILHVKSSDLSDLERRKTSLAQSLS